MGALYYYSARNAEGAFVRGAVEAPNASLALANLRTRALFITSLSAETSPAGLLLHRLTFWPVGHTARVAFFRSFATLISAGVPMLRSLDVAIDQCTDWRLREALCAVRADVQAGAALSEAIAKRPKEFGTLYIAMIRASEVGGVLDAVLERLATLLERERVIRKRVMSALTYPAILAATASLLIVFLLSSIVPMFASLYEQMHVALPRSTRFLLAFGLALHSARHWLGVAVAIPAAALGFSHYMKSNAGAHGWDRLRLRFPLFGPILRKVILARIARMLGSLLKSGVSLEVSLEVVAGIVGNRVYEEHLRLACRALREGDPLADPLKQSSLYGPLLIQMVRVGEETGSLDTMLLRGAEYYEADVETALSTLGATLEPLLIVALGGVVGFIVFSIFIPLYTLIGNIK